MSIFYRFLSCFFQCNNQIPPCSDVLRILLGTESKRELCSWKTTSFPGILHESSALMQLTGTLQLASYVKISALFFFQFITGFPGYNLSWMLLISHYIFKKLVCICSSSDWSFHSLARSMIMWEKGHGVTSPAADLLKLGHHEFIFWFRLMALSHLRKKVNFSPLFGITHWASSQSCVEVILFFQTPNSSEKLHNFLFSFFFFCRKTFKK